MGQSEVAQPRSLALGRLGAGGGSPSPVAKPDQKIVDRGDQTRLDPLDCQIRMGPTERRKKFGKREWQVRRTLWEGGSPLAADAQCDVVEELAVVVEFPFDAPCWASRRESNEEGAVWFEEALRDGLEPCGRFIERERQGVQRHDVGRGVDGGEGFLDRRVDRFGPGSRERAVEGEAKHGRHLLL